MAEIVSLHLGILLNHVTLPVLHALVSQKIAEKLQDGPLTAEELSASTEINPNRLFRYLRIASFSGFFSHDSSTNKWSNTPKSLIITNTFSRAIWAWIGDPFILEHFLHFPAALTSNNDPRSDRNKPNSFIEISQNPHLLNIFQTLMTEITKHNMPELLNSINIREAKSILDLGGADGSLAINLSKKYPEVTFAVFDRPEVKPLCEHFLTISNSQDRVQFIGGDFFERVPSGFDCIIMKHIIHDWNDEAAITILTNCRNTLKTGDKLHIIDYIVDPNSKFYSASLASDSFMLMINNGQERTLKQLENILALTRFKIINIIPVEAEANIEAEAIE